MFCVLFRHVFLARSLKAKTSAESATEWAKLQSGPAINALGFFFIFTFSEFPVRFLQCDRGFTTYLFRLFHCVMVHLMLQVCVATKGEFHTWLYIPPPPPPGPRYSEPCLATAPRLPRCPVTTDPTPPARGQTSTDPPGPSPGRARRAKTPTGILAAHICTSTALTAPGIRRASTFAAEAARGTARRGARRL